MGRRRLTEDDFKAMIAAFRRDKPHYRPGTASTFCDLDSKTLKKAWHEGFPTREWPPIKAIIEAEIEAERETQLQAVASRRSAISQEQSAIREASQKAVDQEAQMVTLSRASVLANLAASATLVSRAPSLAKSAQARIEADLKLAPDHADRLTAIQAVSLLERLATFQEKMIRSAAAAMKLEMLFKQKTPGGGISPVDVPLTLEQAEAAARSTLTAIEHAKQVAGLSGVGEAGEEVVVGQRFQP